MIFFDLLYYSVYRFYSKQKEKGAQSTSAGIIGGFQAINVLTGIFLFEFFSGRKVPTDKWIIIVLFLAFQVFTYYRYLYLDNPSLSVIEKKWNGKTEKSQTQIRISLFLYGAFSIITFFGFAIYLGSRN